MDQNHLHNFERGPTKDHSCEVWSKSNQWFRWRCCLKKLFTDALTHQRTMDKMWSQKLILSLGDRWPKKSKIQISLCSLLPSINFCKHILQYQIFCQGNTKMNAHIDLGFIHMWNANWEIMIWCLTSLQHYLSHMSQCMTKHIMAFAHSKDRSAVTQSDQSLCCVLNG